MSRPRPALIVNTFRKSSSSEYLRMRKSSTFHSFYFEESCIFLCSKYAEYECTNMLYAFMQDWSYESAFVAFLFAGTPTDQWTGVEWLMYSSK